VPDLTLWLDLPLEESRRRRGHRPADRIEASGDAFLARVANGFARLAAERGWVRVDATQLPERVLADCQRQLQERFAVARR
jgi:dTMP kinase